MKKYSVRKIIESPMLSGAGDDPLWNNAAELSDFSFPWETETPQQTIFKALHNDRALYCLFHVHDRSVNIFQDTGHKMEVVSSSRAEIFFRENERLAPYFCLEIDPECRVLDYQGELYRKFDFEWSWPDNGLFAKSHRWPDGYSVELAITKQSLQNLNLIKNNSLQVGLFRADCKFRENGEPAFKWISWVRPDSESPDFHIPSAFGLMELQD